MMTQAYIALGALGLVVIGLCIYAYATVRRVDRERAEFRRIANREKEGEKE